MGFITGKLLDSAIIGAICYIGCLIMNMPYALLVSVIIGVTNVIPFFGPFIGAIPSALLILLVDPWKCLIFIIFIIILQQVDGNIIGAEDPRRLNRHKRLLGHVLNHSVRRSVRLLGNASRRSRIRRYLHRRYEACG